MVERLTCSCPDWASGTEAINGPIIEKAVRSGLTWQFTGKKFRFCPWCGKALAPPAPEAELVARIVLEGGSVKADFVPPFSAPPAPEATDG